MLVYLVSRANGRTEVVTLLLTGIAVNAFAGAGHRLRAVQRERCEPGADHLLAARVARPARSGARSSIVAVVAVAGVIVATCLGRRYDVLALGERNARHLGIDVERLRLISVVLVALLTGVAVAFVGIIAFVGLVVPHVVRMLLGPGHRALIPVSAVGGAVLLLYADLLARNLVPGAELPIGLLTSLVGGPFFFFLLWRQRRRAGGWA